MSHNATIAAVLVAVLSASIWGSAQEPSAGAIDFGDASGEPGESISVPIYVSSTHPIVNMTCPFRFDPETLEFHGFAPAGASAGVFDPAEFGFANYDPGDAILQINSEGRGPDGAVLPAGENVQVGAITIRIRGGAAAGATSIEPVETVSGAKVGPTVTVRVGGANATLAPQSLVAGAVNVRPPSGPRAVDDLTCEQFLARMQITFRLNGAYDALAVTRDGTAIAQLPGDATSFEEPLPPVGTHSYEVTALAGGKASRPAPCAAAVGPPQAPAPHELSCKGAALTWKNAVPYDRILIEQNGVPLVELPGDAEGFTAEPSDGSQRVFGVVAELQGFKSAEVFCVDPGVWVLEIGDVLVPPGAGDVLVPLFATNPAPALAISFCVEVDVGRFSPVRDKARSLAGTAGYPSPEFFASGGIGLCGFPSLTVIWDQVPPREPHKDLPPGTRQLIGSLILRPKTPLVDGESFPLRLITPDLSPIGPSIFTRFDTSSQVPTFAIPGQIRVGASNPAAVRRLVASKSGSNAHASVTLDWTNGAGYSAVRIERNGAEIASLPGDRTEFLDNDPPEGVLIYKVSGLVGGKSSFPAMAVLTTFAHANAFLRGDSNRDGVVDIGDAITTLSSLFLDGKPFRCEDSADADDDGELTISDAIVTLSVLFLGGADLRSPGARFPWFDPTADLLDCGE